MEPRAAAGLKTALVGVALPAEKAELLAYAVQQHAEPQLLEALRALPERDYASLDEVLEELVDVQPHRLERGPAPPHEESGRPPGGDAYTDRPGEP